MTGEAPAEGAPARGVRSVARALRLLSATARGARTLTELAAAAEVSLSTASRLLGTLKMEGYVHQDEEGKYIPGPELTALLYASDQWSGIRALVTEATNALRDELDETAAFFVRSGAERICIVSAESARLVRRVCAPGEQGPIYRGAAGKALLAFERGEGGDLGLPAGAESFRTESGTERTLRELRDECRMIRELGYSYSGRESTEESWAVAAPLHRDGVLLGVLAVVVPMTRSEDDYVEEVTARLRAVAAGWSS